MRGTGEAAYPLGVHPIRVPKGHCVACQFDHHGLVSERWISEEWIDNQENELRLARAVILDSEALVAARASASLDAWQAKETLKKSLATYRAQYPIGRMSDSSHGEPK